MKADPTISVGLVSGHQANWNAGASTVFLHLDRELRSLGHDVRLYHLSDFALGGGSLQKLTVAKRLAGRLGAALATRDVVEVAGNIAWSMFRSIKRVPPGAQRPLCVSRLHGLEFKDEQAFAWEEIAGHARLPLKYKLLTRHLANWQERRTLAEADVVVCHSSRDVDAIVAAGWKDADDIELMPLGVDADFLFDRQHEGPGHRLLWWGSWVERKGISSLPRAFALAASERADLTLTVGGAGASPDAVHAAFPEALRPRVRVLPFVTHEQHVQVLRDHDIFIFPSISEGFGLSLVEAMAASLPSITTFTGLAHDWLEHGENCLLVPISGPTAMARSIVRLANDPDLRRRIGRGGQRTARQLTWERFGQATADVYTRRLAKLAARRSIPIAARVDGEPATVG